MNITSTHERSSFWHTTHLSYFHLFSHLPLPLPFDTLPIFLTFISFLIFLFLFLCLLFLIPFNYFKVPLPISLCLKNQQRIESTNFKWKLEAATLSTSWESPQPWKISNAFSAPITFSNISPLAIQITPTLTTPPGFISSIIAFQTFWILILPIPMFQINCHNVPIRLEKCFLRKQPFYPQQTHHKCLITSALLQVVHY